MLVPKVVAACVPAAIFVARRTVISSGEFWHTSSINCESATPPIFHSPCCAQEDSFYLATGRQLWDASLKSAIASSTLSF